MHNADLTGAGNQVEPTEATRRRLVAALAESIVERGYTATTVVDIVRAARASKRTFYLHFANKQECYLALLAMMTDTVVSDIRAAVNPDLDWRSQIGQAVEAYIANIAARPAIGLSWIRDLPAFGVSARSVQRRNFAELAALIAELSSNAGFRRAALPPITGPKIVILLAGIRELVAQTAEDGRDIATVIGPVSQIAIAILAADDGITPED